MLGSGADVCLKGPFDLGVVGPVVDLPLGGLFGTGLAERGFVDGDSDGAPAGSLRCNPGVVAVGVGLREVGDPVAVAASADPHGHIVGGLPRSRLRRHATIPSRGNHMPVILPSHHQIAIVSWRSRSLATRARRPAVWVGSTALSTAPTRSPRLGKVV